MKKARSLPILLLLVALCVSVAGAPQAHAQAPGVLDNGYRNNLGLPVPALPAGVAAPVVGSPLREAYLRQKENGTAFGGFPIWGYGTLQTNQSATQPPVLGVPQNFPRSVPGPGVPLAVELRSSIIGRPLALFSISYNFGGEIPAPVKIDGSGVTKTYLKEPLNARLKTTVVVTSGVETSRTVVNATSSDLDGKTTTTVGPTTTTVTTGLNPQFYWSKHSQTVYATQPGTIKIQWRETLNTDSFEETYTIATSPAKPERKLYWTENGFNGPLVEVPAGRVNQVNLIYNTLVPKEVVEPYAPWTLGIVDIAETDPLKRRYKTVYFDNSLIHAYNVEGRLFVEYLGNPRDDGTNETKGTEIVNIIKEVTPETRIVDLGEEVGTVANSGASLGLTAASFDIDGGTTVYSEAPTVTISGGGGTGATATAVLNGIGVVNGITITDSGSGYTTAPTLTFSGGTVATAGVNPTGTAISLEAKIIAGLGIVGQPYLHEHISAGGTKRTLFAIKDTQPGVVIGGKRQQTSNEVLIYWRESGVQELKWPKQYLGYILEWPVSQAKYSTYARPDSSLPGGLNLALATGVQLDSANNPALVFQDDPTNSQALIVPDNKFYTKVTASDAINRALLRFTKDEDIWFERIYSQLDTTFSGYAGTFDNTVFATFDSGGVTLSAPGGFLKADGTYSVTVTNSATGTPYILGVDYLLGKDASGADILTRLYNGTSLNLDPNFPPDDPNFPAGNAGADNTIRCVALQGDGKLLIGGEFTQVNGQPRSRLARLNRDGSLDDTFLAAPLAGPNGNVRTIAVQSDGRVLIGGGSFSNVNGVNRSNIARLNSDGTLDTSFLSGLNGAGGWVRTVLVQTDGKVLLSGDFQQVNGQTRNYIARLNTNGSLDTGFLANPLTGANNYIFSMALQSDGKVVIGGIFTSVNGTTRNRIARLNTDGSLDPAFLASPLTGVTNNNVQSLAIQSDGKVLIAGAFTQVNGVARSRLARLNTDGSLDTGFLAAPLVGPSNTLYSVALQRDGKVLIGGTFTAFNGVARTNLARLNADGSLDTPFQDLLGGPNGEVDVIAVQPNDGAVIIGGAFTQVNGETHNRLARLDPYDPRVPDNVTLTFGGAAAYADIGERIEPPNSLPATASDGPAEKSVYVGYIHQDSGTAFNYLAYQDPFVVGFEEAAKGAIIGVNALPDKDKLEVWWYKKSTPRGAKITGTYWPSFVQKYQLRWPATPSQIVLASNKGSDDLPSLQATGAIYHQNQPTAVGFNPNEEHALMLNGRAWALRDDLNLPVSSQPYVLLRYTEADQRPAMKVFKVVRGSFDYPAVAGVVLQSPMPLPLLPPPVLPDRTFANYEIAGVADPRTVSTVLTTTDAAFRHYEKFTWTDRKGTVWVYRGPDQVNQTTPTPTLIMRYFYNTLDSFYFPSLAYENQPPVGTTITPYLRSGSPGAYLGNPVTGEVDGVAAGVRKEQPLDVTFRPQWPASAPELRVGETLTLPKLGLPSVRGQASAEFIYQQSIAMDATVDTQMANRQKSARLFDPTRAKVFALGAPFNTTNTLSKIPESVNTSLFLGKTYFPNLPPHLSTRLYFDPAVGQYGSLLFKGVFMNELVGEKYLQLNVMSTADITAAKGLTPAGTDTDSIALKTNWDAAIAGLATTVETFTEDPSKLGTFIPLRDETITKRSPIIIAGSPFYIPKGTLPLVATVAVGGTIGTDIRPPTKVDELAEVFYSDSAVDSYAVSASGGGKGFVVLAVGNGVDTDFTLPGNPVSLHVFKVNAPLYRGELKVINSANPLDEKLTLQHTGDFAGRPEEYDFEWRYAPPVDGLPPRLYSFVRTLVVGDSSSEWRLINNPSLNVLDPAQNYTKYRSPSASVQDVVTAINVTLGGGGYTSVPTVTVTGGGGTGAAGTAVLTGGTLSGITLTNRGSGYTSVPAVNITGGGGSGAAASAAKGQPVAGLPGLITINDGNGTAENGTTLPNALLRRVFTYTQRPLRLFVSVELGINDGAAVYLNNAPVASYRVPGIADSATTTVPATSPAFDPLTLVFEIDPNTLSIDSPPNNNVLTVELYTTADARSTTTFNVRLEGSQEVENLTSWLPLGLVPPETASSLSTLNNAVNPQTNGIVSVQGKNRHTIQGTSILTLSDNWLIMRYRARNTTNAAFAPFGGWSKWTEPQLAEGWIKRVLAGINPFQQRIKDLFNHQTNTSVSLVEQAGKRWEGDIALNLDNINDSGLIEIYETVLRRGKMLSIAGTPAINYGGANDALLLAAGYLSDLYMILGNEAYADAANSTIAFNTEGASAQYGDVATALFSFKGQLATVLDEELALLRGRDDFLLPGTQKTPIYNRLIWNYTRGISSGEAIYALNYNIKDRVWDYSITASNPANLPADGIISAADAATSYPQGHGDAYGHYLTALTGYYGLLNNPNFSWTPRIEAVLVLGTPVSVDYQDERKFAAAAVAVARSASQTLDLTYRQEFSAAENAGWSKLHDAKANTNTSRTRSWGTDDWASRGGQGALFHWVTANSLLPAVDPDPNHSGIQKIDRTTVPELAEISAQAGAIQQTLDNADARLNPLGLATSALTFDISPSEVDAGNTHYEQVFQRAIGALQNAVSAFNNAKGSTQFLRQQEDTLADQRNAIEAQEQAFTNQLIELYGTPYTDDIGPGKTYKQDYAGPDLLHSAYVDLPEKFQGSGAQTTYTLLLDPNFADANKEAFDSTALTEGKSVTFVLSARGEVVKPAAWTGRRVSPGRMQTSVSDLLLARQTLQDALETYSGLKDTLNRKIQIYDSSVESYNGIVTNRIAVNGLIGSLISLKAVALIAKLVGENAREAIDAAEDAIVQGTPTIIGPLAADPGSALRLSAVTSSRAAKLSSKVVTGGLEVFLATADDAIERLNFQYQSNITEAQFIETNKQLLYELHTTLDELKGGAVAVDAAIRHHDQAQRDLYTLQAGGDRIQQERLVFRQHSAAIIQGYRTRDFAFRAFRDEALERYKALFDLSARYTYLAARAYDYETGLLDPSGNAAAAGFYEKIVQARALGVVSGGQPQFAGASTGDPGLSGVLAALAGDWSVAKTRLGFNNPDHYATTFSLRGEKLRLVAGADGDLSWKDQLSSYRMADILQDPDVKRYCMQVADPNGNPVPGIVIPFSSTIATGYNFFGRPLAGGDHTFTPSSFSTKIRSSGIAFAGYVGMDSPTTTSGALGEIGATSPSNPNTGFSDPNALSATPYIYLIPAGSDSMRSPPLGDSSVVRTWTVEDQAIPLPFNIANSAYSTQPAWVSAASLTEPAFTLRKHQGFRAVPDGTNFQDGVGFTNARLIGRSAWNSQWKIVIPGNTLLNDPNLGLQTFINTVKDIKLHLETYSYSGN